MQLKVSFSLILVLVGSFLLAAPVKYPIYSLGIKFNKPSKYFLATTETRNDIKTSLLTSGLVCSQAKKSIEQSFSNPNFKIFLNVEDFNEQIYFYKVLKNNISKDISKSIKERIKEHCMLTGEVSVSLIRDTAGTCSFGNYTALLFKINTPEIAYYSEGFFIEGKSGTLLVTINSINKTSNFVTINSIEFISTEKFETLITEITELMSLKNYKAAQLKADTCIMIEPQNVRGYEKRMAINLYYKKYSDVIKDADLIMGIDENYLNGLIVKGLAYFSLEEHLSAIECFELVEKKISILSLLNLQNDYYTSKSHLYRLKGEGFMKMRNAKSAIENLENALTFSVDSFNTGGIYYNIGVVHSQLLNNSEEAIKYYSLSIINYSNNNPKEKSEAYFNRAINYRKKGKDNDAMTDYTNAIKLRPDYAKAYNNRSSIKLGLEDYKGAIIDCSAAIKHDNGKTEVTGLAYYNRGAAKLSLNDINGCSDMKKAKSLGVSIPKEILEGCNIK